MKQVWKLQDMTISRDALLNLAEQKGTGYHSLGMLDAIDETEAYHLIAGNKCHIITCA